MSMLNKDDLLVSLRRTLVPMVVGLVAGSFLAGYVELLGSRKQPVYLDPAK